MDNQIVIHATEKQKRIALIENGELAQFFIESPENRRSVGDIYLAQVHKVMGGIRAAFIDVSTPKDAFLHYSDLGEHLEEYLMMLNGRDAISAESSKELHDFRKQVKENTVQGMSNKQQTMHEQNLLGNLLKSGQKIMVQVVKEPIGSKGPRVSTDITLAGRFLVLIPFGDYVAVSKRIRSYKERRRLKSVLTDMMPNGFGVIVRTVAEGQKTEALQEDLKDLHDKWLAISEKLKNSKPTALLHRDLDMTESLVRDLFSKNYNRILVDDPASFKIIKNYVSRIAPSMVKNIEQYKGREHIFDHLNIGRDVESIFSPRVKMPSGGYLIFEQTEAMYVVDVNSGRYAAKKAQEDNSLKTNLEAAREIAKQLRLRDIGGIIVVDFIDLQDDVNRKKIYDELKKEFKKDRAKTNVLAMSDFGLVQITRQRIRPSVVKSVSKVCPMCGGAGTIVSENTLLSDVEAWITKFKYEYNYRSVDLFVNPYFHSVLCQGLISQRLKWMFKFLLKINIMPDESISLNDYKATLSGSDIDISDTVLTGGSIEEKISETERSIAELESEGKRNNQMLEVYKKEDRRQNNGRQQKNNNNNRGRSSSSNTDTESKSVSPNTRVSSKVRSRDKVKSKYYKSGEQSNNKDNQSSQISNDAENLPNALDVAKAYAKRVLEEEKDKKKEVKKDTKSEKPKRGTKKKKTEEEKEDIPLTTEVKKAKAPKRVKKPTRSPRKKVKSDTNSDTKGNKTGTEQSPKKDNSSDSKNDNRNSIIEKAKAEISKELKQKDSLDGEKKEAVKRSTVKKKANTENSEAEDKKNVQETENQETK